MSERMVIFVILSDNGDIYDFDLKLYFDANYMVVEFYLNYILFLLFYYSNYTRKLVFLRIRTFRKNPH